MMQELTNQIKNNELFFGFSEEELEKVIAIAHIKEYPSNYVLFKEGEVSRELYLLISGTVQVDIAVSPDDKSILDFNIVEIREGEVFGHFSFIDKEPRSATIKTGGSQAKVLSIVSEDLDKLIESDTMIGYKFYKNLSKNICNLMRNENSYLKIMLDYHM